MAQPVNKTNAFARVRSITDQWKDKTDRVRETEALSRLQTILSQWEQDDTYKNATENELLSNLREILERWIDEDIALHPEAYHQKTKEEEEAISGLRALNDQLHQEELKVTELIEILDRENLTDNQIGLLVADILVGDIPTFEYIYLIHRAKRDPSLKRVADNATKVLNRANGQ